MTEKTRQLVKLTGALFAHSSLGHQGYKKATNYIFKNPIDFSINENETYAVIGNDYKTDFLQILSGSGIAFPNIQARSYPLRLIDSEFKVDLLKFVNNGSWGHGAHDASGGFTHLSSRYEFFKDLEIDEKVSDFIADISYNSRHKFDAEKVGNLLAGVNLKGLEDRFITTLSNGQFRRARIAKALYMSPNLLLIDDPFLGLDPKASEVVSRVLENTAKSSSSPTTITIGLRIQDPIPAWVDKVAVVDQNGIVFQGFKKDLESRIQELKDEYHQKQTEIETKIRNRIHLTYKPADGQTSDKENMIEMNGVNVLYKGKPALKDLFWKVEDGEKWHVRGKNGSGKTTLLSLITLDHPQSWNRNIKIKGISRATGKTNYFDNNKIIGFTSPELHAIFPKNLNVVQVISTGFIVGSYIPPTDLTESQLNKIIGLLEITGLGKYLDTQFKDIPLSTQKFVLLLRALINDPKILILDEALSGMTDEDIIKGKSLIDEWKTGCALIIGHVEHEVPRCDKFIDMNNASEGQYVIGEV